MVEVELYRKSPGELDSIYDLLQSSTKNSQTRELYAQLGFHFLAGDVRIPDVSYARMTTFEAEVWQRFLPTGYGRNEGEWGLFSFDHIPEQVLQEIEYATSLGCFDNLHIRTPERTSLDPLVYGTKTIGNRKNRYIIARWGESLLPFVEIAKQVFLSSIYWDGIRRFTLRQPIAEKLFSLWLKECVGMDEFRSPFLRKVIFGWHCGERKINLSIGNSFSVNMCAICGA